MQTYRHDGYSITDIKTLNFFLVVTLMTILNPLFKFMTLHLLIQNVGSFTTHRIQNSTERHPAPYTYTSLSDICQSDDREIFHWRQPQAGRFDSKEYDWRKLGREAWKCSSGFSPDGEVGFMAIIVEGAVCNGVFEPLRTPRLFNFGTRAYEMRCFPDISGQPIEKVEFRYGLFMLTSEREGYVGFPILPSTAVRQIDLRHRRPRIPHTDPYTNHYAVIGASELTCHVDIKFVELPKINFRGHASIFYAFEADYRSCGYAKPSGHDAVAIIPFPQRQDRRENLRLMFHEMRNSLKPFSDSLRFFTSALRYHGIRAIVIEADFLLDKTTDLSITKERVLPSSNFTLHFQRTVYPFLSSLFIQGIVVCIATFDRSTTTTVSRPELINNEGFSFFVVPGEPRPSDTYTALLQSFRKKFSATVIESQQGPWVASLSGRRTVYRPESLVSLIIDGIQSSPSNENKTILESAQKRNPPVAQLITYWREIASTHYNVEAEERSRPLEETEIAIIATTSSDWVDCHKCSLLRGGAGTIQLDQLNVVMPSK